MIPADGTAIALIQSCDARRYRRPVHAWADDGHPMVIGHQGLVRAESIGIVEKIMEDGDSFFRIVAALPGDGWMLESDNGQDCGGGTPIVAWLIRSDGSVTAAAPNANGIVVENLDASANGPRVYRPGTESE